MKKLAPYSILIILCLSFITHFSYSQGRTIFGSVTTFEVIPIIKAEITIKSSKEIIFTDTLGYFEVTCDVKDKIKISADGFFTQNIKLTADDDTLLVDLKLRPQSENLAISSGHIKDELKLRARITKGVDYSAYNSVYEILDAKFPNIQVPTIDDVEHVIIGSPSSLDAQNTGALIVIDGIISFSSSLDNLSPLDITNIEILKPGAETSIYGSQGGNGAVRITTKRGGSF
ncbi:MAG: TonB-dependent receptor plug domain-containing protein [Mariniphaga sp.]|nr:TonB-dependent receptor plug domain-containing protein [Mariniphaga sp.]